MAKWWWWSMVQLNTSQGPRFCLQGNQLISPQRSSYEINDIYPTFSSIYLDFLYKTLNVQVANPVCELTSWPSASYSPAESWRRHLQTLVAETPSQYLKYFSSSTLLSPLHLPFKITSKWLPSIVSWCPHPQTAIWKLETNNLYYIDLPPVKPSAIALGTIFTHTASLGILAPVFGDTYHRAQAANSKEEFIKSKETAGAAAAWGSSLVGSAVQTYGVAALINATGTLSYKGAAYLGTLIFFASSAPSVRSQQSSYPTIPSNSSDKIYRLWARSSPRSDPSTLSLSVRSRGCSRLLDSVCSSPGGEHVLTPSTKWLERVRWKIKQELLVVIGCISQAFT